MDIEQQFQEIVASLEFDQTADEMEAEIVLEDLMYLTESKPRIEICRAAMAIVQAGVDWDLVSYSGEHGRPKLGEWANSPLPAQPLLAGWWYGVTSGRSAVAEIYLTAFLKQAEKKIEVNKLTY